MTKESHSLLGVSTVPPGHPLLATQSTCNSVVAKQFSVSYSTENNNGPSVVPTLGVIVAQGFEALIS